MKATILETHSIFTPKKLFWLFSVSSLWRSWNMFCKRVKKTIRQNQFQFEILKTSQNMHWGERLACNCHTFCNNLVNMIFCRNYLEAGGQILRSQDTSILWAQSLIDHTELSHFYVFQFFNTFDIKK